VHGRQPAARRPPARRLSAGNPPPPAALDSRSDSFLISNQPYHYIYRPNRCYEQLSHRSPMQRHQGAFGFFSSERFVNASDPKEITDEIALNPLHFATPGS
jgi:hypothetical protein